MGESLQGDQRALLQLLCERGQSYEDISGLLGVPADEVRERARTALSVIGGADPDAEVGLTDYLLGQADPIGRADAVRHLQADPEALELAKRIQASLTLIAPAGKQATLPEPRGKRRRAAIAPADEALTGSGTLSTGAEGESTTAGPGLGRGTPQQTRTIAILAGVGLILVVVILAVAGVFGSGDDAAPDSSATSDSSAVTNADGEEPAGGDAENITSVSLSPVAGSGVAGSVEFGLLAEEQLVVDLRLQGLDPKPSGGNAYLVWLMVGDQAGYPISMPLEPDANGAVAGRLSVPTAIAVTIGGQADSVRVSESPLDELRKEVRLATEQEAPILPFVGTDLAEGEIPLIRDGRGQGGGASGE